MSTRIVLFTALVLLWSCASETPEEKATRITDELQRQMDDTHPSVNYNVALEELLSLEDLDCAYQGKRVKSIEVVGVLDGNGRLKQHEVSILMEAPPLPNSDGYRVYPGIKFPVDQEGKRTGRVEPWLFCPAVDGESPELTIREGEVVKWKDRSIDLEKATDRECYEFYLTMGRTGLFGAEDPNDSWDLRKLRRRSRAYLEGLLRDPAYIALLVDKLGSADEEEALVTMHELNAIGAPAVPVLTARLRTALGGNPVKDPVP